MEDVQRFAILQLLLVKVADTVYRLFSLTLLPDEHVAGIVEIAGQGTGKRAVLNEGLRLLRPISEDVCET